MGIINDYSPAVEVFSIDECFADVTDTQTLFGGGVVEMAWEIKHRIRQEVGEWMRCSIGISFSKLVAKLASEMKKPDGLVILTPDSYLSETEEVKVEEVCGIGYSRAKYLRSRGIYTLGQARKISDLPAEINGLVWLRGDEPLVTNEDLEPAKSVSRTYTTFSMLNAQDSVLKLVRNLVEEACAKLREMGMVGRTFCLSLSSFRYLTPSPSPSLVEGHYSFWVRRTVKMPTDDPLIVFNLLNKEYEKNPVIGVRQAGVWISNLAFSNWHLAFVERREEFLRAVDEVNEKHGLFTLYPASLLDGELIRPEVTGYLGDKYYRFNKERWRR
jgi:DNA polymerase-4